MPQSTASSLSIPRQDDVSQVAGRWNNTHLPQRLFSDLTAAASAAVLVSPLITMIDRGIIENASNRRPLRASLTSSFSTLITRPHVFLLSTPFLLITTLYFGTYATANIIDTLTSTIKNKPASSVTAGPTKFIATTGANITLCLYKDSRFTRMFGPIGSSPRPVPGPSFVLFALRDSMTIFASFNLPPLIAPHLPLASASLDLDIEKYMSRASAAQFLAPAGIQLFSTPLHLLGLDLYNRGEGGIGWRARAQKVRRDWLGSSFARMGRIIPAFGVGGVVNSGVRKRMMGMIEE